ncbi:MAG: IS200/IS605 family transposase [Polyangiales bacterium]
MSHHFTELFVHLVWSTSRRESALEASFATRVHHQLALLCARARAPALAVGGVADHVHLLVALHPTVAVSTLVRTLKTNTSPWIAREIHCPTIAWQNGYSAFSVHPAGTDVVRKYIQNQAQHHASSSLINEWEPRPSP